MQCDLGYLFELICSCLAKRLAGFFPCQMYYGLWTTFFTFLSLISSFFSYLHFSFFLFRKIFFKFNTSNDFNSVYSDALPLAFASYAMYLPFRPLITYTFKYSNTVVYHIAELFLTHDASWPPPMILEFLVTWQYVKGKDRKFLRWHRSFPDQCDKGKHMS